MIPFMHVIVVFLLAGLAGVGLENGLPGLALAVVMITAMVVVDAVLAVLEEQRMDQSDFDGEDGL